MDVSNVNDMSFMFYHANEFNGDRSLWNISNVTIIKGIFYYAKKFDQDISTKTIEKNDGTSYKAWDVLQLLI